MIKQIMSAGLMLPFLGGIAYADNIAACEVVLLETVMEEGQPTQAKMASFRPAAEFISSVYDDKDGHVDELDGFKIRGVMCTRKKVMPSLRDFPILATGIPFSVSENFDSPESRLLTLYYKEGEFKHKYSGPDMDEKSAMQLGAMMEVFNLQPHELGKEAAKKKPKAKMKKETADE